MKKRTEPTRVNMNDAAIADMLRRLAHDDRATGKRNTINMTATLYSVLVDECKRRGIEITEATK